MTTPTKTPGTDTKDRYPVGDPVSITGTIGEPYETTDEHGDPVGIAEHIVAVTGITDEVGDVFVPGVFADVIRRGPKAKGVSGHDWGIKVSKALEREEWMPGDPRIAQRIVPALPEGKSWPREAGAVYVKALYNLRTPEGRRAYENAKFFGPEESYSVGYKVAAGGARRRGGRRFINRLEGWYEWSDVLHGANHLAFGLSVKGLLDSEMEHSGGRIAQGGESKAIRRVSDSQYWGMPIGTVIRPGMKPRGPKALRMRRAGETPDPTAGTTTKKPKNAPGAGRDKPDAEGMHKPDQPGKDPMADREMLPGEARALLRDAVKANIQARKHDRPTRFSEERDEILADLRKAGYDANVDDYENPDDVGEVPRSADNADGSDDRGEGGGEPSPPAASTPAGETGEAPAANADAAQEPPSSDGDVDTAPGATQQRASVSGDRLDEADPAALTAIENQDRSALVRALTTMGGDELVDLALADGTQPDGDPTGPLADELLDMDPEQAQQRVRDMVAKGHERDRERTDERLAESAADYETLTDAELDRQEARMRKLAADDEADAYAKRVASDALGVIERERARRRGSNDTSPDADAEREPSGAPDDDGGETPPESDAEADKNRAELDVPAGGKPASTDTAPADDTAESAADDTDTADEDAAADEVISADELADGEDIAADAHGLIEADDGELEVTTEVADRQDRVETLLDAGDTAVKDLDDTQLTDARRDVADELALQEEIARRDRRNKRAVPADTGGDASAAPDAEPGSRPEPAGDEESGDAAGAPAAEAAPATPKVRAGLAGAAEDYADALESGDQDTIGRARDRLESSLRRSRSDSPQLEALRSLLTVDDPDPKQIRDLAETLREAARQRRNEQARSRRLAKRLERERLRSLLGQIDAEMRTRGLSPDAGPPNAQAGPPNVGAAQDDRPVPEEGVISPDDLAAARAAAGEPEPVDELEPPVEPPVTEPEPEVVPVAAPSMAAATGLPAGEWTSLDTLPVRVAGAYYEATIDADPAHPGKFEYSFRVVGPDGDIAGLGSGRADSIDDARRYVAADLGETFNSPGMRGVPPGETLPDAPPEPSAVERAEAVQQAAQVARQTRDDINPLTGEKDYTVAPPLADAPAGTPPFVDANEVREHLLTAGAPGFGGDGKPGIVQWDTALLSPGGGLMMFRKAQGGNWVVAHTGSGGVITNHVTLGRRDAREMMDTLERMVGSAGRQIDWTVPTGAEARRQITDAGLRGDLGTDLVSTALAVMVAKRVDAGDYTSKVVGDARMSAGGSEYRMAGKFPNWRPGMQHMVRTSGALDSLLHSGRSRSSGEDRSREEIADDAATVKVGKGAVNLVELGAPDKAAAVLERRADELEAKYGRGSGPYDVTSGGASSRGSVMLRRMADDVRTMVNVEPQGVEALAAAKPGDRFIVLDNSPTPGNPQVDPTRSYRTFTVAGRRPADRYDTSGEVLLDVREDDAPPGPQDTMLVRVVARRGSRESSVVMPRWVNRGAGQRQQLGEAGERWVPVAPDRSVAVSSNADTRDVARLAAGEEPPATFRDAQDRVKLTTREPIIEQAIAGARARLDAQAGEINVVEPPKQRQTRTRSTARVGGRATQPAPAAGGAREGSAVSQAVLDVQVANQTAIVGGPIDLADTAPNQGYDDIAAVRRAWASGTDQAGAPMPGGGEFVRDRAGDDRWWNGVKLSPAGHFLVMPNGDVTHADSGQLVTGRAGPLPTQAAALRYADMLERVVLPTSDASREPLDWTGNNPDAMRVVRAATGLAQQANDAAPTARIRARAILDEGLNPRAVKAVLAAQTRWEDSRRPQDTRLLMLDTAPWGNAFQARDMTPTAGRRNYWLGGKPGGLTFSSRDDERRSEELRKLLVWAQTMATPAPYTVADELRRYQRDHQDDTVTFTTRERAPNSSYDTVAKPHEVNLGDIAGQVAEQLEHDADPTRWSESEKLTAAGEGTLKVDSGEVVGTIDRLVSDNDHLFIEREAQLHTTIAEIGAGGIQMRYDQQTRQWVAVLPRHAGARAGMGEGTGPLEIRTPSRYGGAAPRGHESDEVLITPDGGLRLRFRMQGDDPDIYSPSIARLSIPPGAWSLDDGSEPGEPPPREPARRPEAGPPLNEIPDLRPSDIDEANPGEVDDQGKAPAGAESGAPTTTRDALRAELALPPVTGGSDDQRRMGESIRADLETWAIMVMDRLDRSIARNRAKGRDNVADEQAAARELLVPTVRAAADARWLIQFRQMLQQNPANALLALVAPDDRRRLATADMWVPDQQARQNLGAGPTSA